MDARSSADGARPPQISEPAGSDHVIDEPPIADSFAADSFAADSLNAASLNAASLIGEPVVDESAIARRPVSRPASHALLPVVTMSATAMLLVVGAFLASRRLVGAMHRPLDALSLLIATMILVTVSIVLHFAWVRLLGPEAAKKLLYGAAGAIAGLLLLFAFSFSLPGTPMWGLALLWLTVASLISHRFTSVFHGAVRGERPNGDRSVLPPHVADQHTPDHSQWSMRRAVADDETGDHSISQQITRATESDGSEVLFGTLSGRFESRQRNGSLHISFCPPLDAIPDFWAEQTDGPPAKVQVAQVETYGARIDVRLLDVSNDATSVAVEFFGRATVNKALRA